MVAGEEDVELWALSDNESVNCQHMAKDYYNNFPVEEHDRLLPHTETSCPKWKSRPKSCCVWKSLEH